MTSETTLKRKAPANVFLPGNAIVSEKLVFIENFGMWVRAYVAGISFISEASSVQLFFNQMYPPDN